MSYTPYIWLLIIPTIIMVWLGSYTRRFHAIPAAQPFRWIMWFGAGYAFIQALAYLTTDLALRIALAEIIIVPVAFTPIATLVLALEYTGHGAWLTRSRLIGLLVIPVTSVLLSLTSANHQLFRYNYAMDLNNPIPELHLAKGPFFWILYIFILVVITAACIRLLASMRETRLGRSNTLLIVTGILIPALADVITVIWGSPIQGFNLSPTLSVVSAALFAWALLHGQLFKVSSLACSTIVDHMEDLVIVTDLHSHIIEFNTSVRQACGLSSKSLGATLNTLPLVWQNLLLAYRNHEAHKEIVSVRQKIYELTSSAIFDHRQRPLGRLFILHDITALKQAETALQESENRLKDVIAGTSIGTWEWNVQTGEVIFNARWAEIIGCTLEELAPVSIQTWLDKRHPDDLKASERQLGEVFSHQREAYDIECRMKHSSGQWIWVQDRGKVIEWTRDGRPLRMAGSQTDITERKRMVDALNASESKFRALFETLPTGVSVVDKTGQITESNQAAENIFGITTSQNIHRLVDGENSIIRPDGTPMPPEEFASQRVLAEKKPVYQVEMGVRQGKQGCIWLNVNAAPLPDNGVVVTYEDITARRQTEEKLRERERLYHAMFDKNKAIKLLIDPNTGSIVDANSAAAEFYGYPLLRLKAMNISDINTLPPKEVQAEIANALAEQRAYYSFSHRLASGEIRAVEVYSSPIEIDGQNLLHSIIHDVSSRKRAEAAESQQRILAEALRNAVAVLNSSLNYEEVLDNILENVDRVVPCEAVELILLDPDGQTARVVRQHDTYDRCSKQAIENHPFILAQTRNLLEIITTGQPLIIPDTNNYNGWVATACSWWPCSNLTVPIKIKGMINGFLALNSSIVNRFTQQDSEYLQIFADQAAIAIYNAQMYGQAHELATTDTLTGLFNRHGLFQLGEREVERAIRTERPLSVLMLDLDHFKKVNDTYGHPMGDRVLIALANCYRFHLRKVDIMARYGGEEFIFILPETDLERAAQIAERLRASVQELSVAVVKENQDEQEEEEVIQITASLGVVRLNSDTCSLSDLIARVDLALYDAKHTGRNRVAVVDYI